MLLNYFVEKYAFHLELETCMVLSFKHKQPASFPEKMVFFF